MNVYVREKVSERERKREALVHAREKYISTCICQREREREIEGKRERSWRNIYISRCLREKEREERERE